MEDTLVEKLAFTIDEFVFASGLSKARIYEILNEGALRAVKCGYRTLVPVEEARRFLASLPPAAFPSKMQGRRASTPDSGLAEKQSPQTIVRGAKGAVQ